ncbi:MAG: hypothetical protein ABIT96_11305 [Ferruginibacter sp.]
MRKIFMLCVVIGLAKTGTAQYYYKDILSNKSIKAEMQAYRDNKIKQVKIKSYEKDGADAQGFFCQKKITKDFSRVELLTKSATTSPSFFYSWFTPEGYVTRSTDSSEIAVTNTTYSYSGDNKLMSIISQSRSQDDDFVTEMREEHIYEYGSSKIPERMLRVKNHSDTTVVNFASDETGNITVEKDSRTGTKYFYYYDGRGRLTDVVMTNDLKTGFVPIYVFEYNSAGKVAQMTASEEGVRNYFIWKYTYEDGLRSKEKCFDRDRRLLGTIEYAYN